MKTVGFIILTIVLFVLLFKIGNTDVSPNVLYISTMILLLSLFSDLKEFNFWGLRGKKELRKELKDLEGKEAISEKNAPKVTKHILTQARQNTEEVVQLMDTAKGNFLELAFTIEKLLRVAVHVVSKEDVPASMYPSKITTLLFEKGLLTKDGIKQIETIRWLRNMLVHGRDNEVDEGTLDAGIQIAYSFYMELKNWLEDTK